MAQDLRSYLDLIKRRKAGEFEIVAGSVDPRYEITALVVKLEREAKRRPVLLFENVKGTRFPVLTNLHASRPRLAEARNESLPLALVIGVHPAIALGALAIGSIDEDERGIMGGLLGEPLELVKCQTSDVLVPAHAEIVLECEILPGQRTPEGPFGEFTGYSLGERQREVVRVNAITHRRDAIFQDITVAHLDHMLLSTIPMEANLFRAVRAMVPSVKAVRVPGPFTCFVSIEQRIPGQAKNAILAALGADLYMKRIVVVDHDVDVFDDRQVNWAIATRCQPDRDITIISNARGSDLDPSTREDGVSGKWGVDATAKPSLAAYTPRHRVPPEVWKRIDPKAFGL